MTLSERAFARATLAQAWQDVLDNDLADGTLSPAGQKFEADAEAKLDDLAAKLACHEWKAGGLSPVEIPKENGDMRKLSIPRLADRIVARAILDKVCPLVDPWLGAGAYAFRPGLGVKEAVREVVSWREFGYLFVVRTDIKDCFPNLPKELALARFMEITQADEWMDRVVTMLAHRRIDGKSKIPPGVPQGCPLSPMLANLVLMDMDEVLLNKGFPVIRYADDLAIMAESKEEAMEALNAAKSAVEELGMELNSEKTAIMDFETGFSFLGEDFNPRYPPLIDRLEEPSRRTLYVAQPGGKVALRKGRIKVFSKNNEELLDAPQSQVARLIVFGSTGISAGVRNWALGNNIDMVLASRKGNYVGTLMSHEDAYRPARLRAQLQFADSEESLKLAQAIVRAKLQKQRVLLQRANRKMHAKETAEAIDGLKYFVERIPESKDRSELMGLEGAGAALYFPCLGALFPQDLAFINRSRRPPRDVTNSALSYLYTVMLGECVNALQAVGLDPGIGVLHSEDEDRPSLALDLMEEFRPFVVDNCVWRAAMLGALKGNHGYEEGGGIYLTKSGRAAVVEAYERRMLQQTSALSGFSGTIRRHLYRQAQRLRSAIMDGEEWSGLSWR